MPKYSLAFTEEMKGFFTFDESDYQQGFDRGQAAGSSIMFHLTIVTDDVAGFVADPSHTAAASGYVDSDVLGGKRPVQQGVFNLFVDAGEVNGEPARHMLYHLWFEDAVGHPLTLSGYKDIRHPAPAVSGAGDVWRETTTLYTRILAGHLAAGHESTAAVLGSGILHILPQDFARQLTTFRVHGPGVPGRLQALQSFAHLFLGQLWDVFRPRLPWHPAS